MARRPNTTSTGNGFDPCTINIVWQKAAPIPGFDPGGVRQDRCGAFIQREAYGDATTPYGWEIDHDKPVAKGGTDDVPNLQPLQWQNNRNKGDDWPTWTCSVTGDSDG